MSTFAVILPAAGQSSRFNNKNYKKPFAPFDGRAVWIVTAERFLNRPDVKQVILIISPEDRDYFQMKFAANVMILGIDVVEGGKERADSITNAVARVKPDVEFICVHDAVRPVLADGWIDRVFETAAKTGAAMLAVPVTATIKRVTGNHTVQETVPREGLWEAQTPQVFRRQLLLDAYAKRGDMAATDDAQLVERLGQPVTVVTGSPLNVKITTMDDLRLAEAALKALPKPKLNVSHPFANDDMWR